MDMLQPQCQLGGENKSWDAFLSDPYWSDLEDPFLLVLVVMLGPTNRILSNYSLPLLRRAPYNLVRFPNPLATGHSWYLGNLTKVFIRPPSSAPTLVTDSLTDCH